MEHLQIRSKDLRRLNDFLATALGRSASGLPLFKWCSMDDIYTSVHCGTREVDAASFSPTATPGLLYCVAPQYRRVALSESEGPGWCIGSWVEPPTEREWVARYGTSIEYPSRGYYQMVTGSRRNDAPPDMPATQFVVSRLLPSLAMGELGSEKRTKAAFEKNSAAVEDRKRREESLIDSMAHDVTTAFGNAPGEKGAVSFGGVSKCQ